MTFTEESLTKYLGVYWKQKKVTKKHIAKGGTTKIQKTVNVF